MVRSDCWTAPDIQSLIQIPPWASPTPATIWHRGVFHNHPFDGHTAVDPLCKQDMAQDKVCRALYLLLASPGSRYRDNFHLPRPRLGQWLFDSDGHPHWIHPASFACAMGLPHPFILPNDDLTAYKILNKTACPPMVAIWLHLALHSIGLGDSTVFYEAFAALLFAAIPVTFRDIVTGRAINHPMPTASHISSEQLAQCTGVPRHLAEAMLETKGCSILPAARVLLQVGIARLHSKGNSDILLATNGNLLQDVQLVDRKLAYNFLRHLDSMQLSLTPALEDLMSQCSQLFTHSAAHEIQKLRTREFPRLAVITSLSFWTDLTIISPRKQAICCAEFSGLLDVAAQLHAARALANSSDTQLPTFTGNPRSTIAASLSGKTYANNTQAIALAALIACFAFDHTGFHHVNYSTGYLATCLGLITTDRRVLF